MDGFLAAVESTGENVDFFPCVKHPAWESLLLDHLHPLGRAVE
jgi:hypothetical protein